jgi:hypothetical protein
MKRRKSENRSEKGKLPRHPFCIKKRSWPLMS